MLLSLIACRWVGGRVCVSHFGFEGGTLVLIAPIPGHCLPFTFFACVHGSTNGTNGIPISFKVLPMVPLVIPLVPMVPLVKTVGSQYCRQSAVWSKLPTLESHMIKYGILKFEFINFTNKHCFIRMLFANNRNTEICT